MNLRVRVVVLAAAVLAVVIVALVLSRQPTRITAPEPRDPILPDLVTLPLFDFLVGTETDTKVESLRFSTTIANVGEGTLHIDAARQDGFADTWQVVQWFDEPDGQRSGAETGANLVFGGHGHDHWHMKFGAAYRLYDADGGELATQTKAGYCWFDQIRLDPEVEGAPEEGVYLPTGCGDRSSTFVEMGMSVGWSDPYFWQLEDQSVVITGIPDGRYRLTAAADPDGWIRESDEENNATWVELEIGTTPEGLRSVEAVDSAE